MPEKLIIDPVGMGGLCETANKKLSAPFFRK